MRRFLLCLLLPCTMAAAFAQTDCRQYEYAQQQLTANPQQAGVYNNIESFTRNLSTTVRTGTSGSGTSSIPAIITIPVIIHILWNTADQNITGDQVQSQLDVLNKDYRAANTDIGKVPSYFMPFVADAGFRFELAKKDPQGRITNGILRKYTGFSNFGMDDRAKYSSIGGDDAWDADKYLNIWVCNAAGGILGYSSLPGDPKDRDGVVINTNVFGTLNRSGQFSKGRTATHEIGHWLNLRHIWGDGNCGDDKVDDTPPQQTPTRGCPSGEKFSCGSTAHGNMYMNYMDFTDDMCMMMFTQGQRERMRALFEPGGPRYALLSSDALDPNGLPQPAPLPETPAAAAFDVLLYPNPTAATLNFSFAEGVNGLGRLIRVYNQMGQLVKSEILSSHQPSMDVTNLRAGLYFIKVEGIKSRIMARFIKQ